MCFFQIGVFVLVPSYDDDDDDDHDDSLIKKQSLFHFFWIADFEESIFERWQVVPSNFVCSDHMH